MTLGLAALHIKQAELRLTGPRDLSPSEVSVVVPVRDNLVGLTRLLSALAALDGECGPGEVIIVDDGSRDAVSIERLRDSTGLAAVRLVRTRGLGPGAARNAGAAAAQGRWLLFTDSDCAPSPTWIAGYQLAMNGAIAYAGEVRAYHADPLSRYCEAQQLLMPPPGRDARPLYLVTANALVLRDAFDSVGGFDEDFKIAGGEDIDIALRLRRVGELSFAPKATVLHDFSGGVRSLVRRCVRYGKGNRMLAEKYGVDLSPRTFQPALPGWANAMAACFQFVGLWLGYRMPGTNHP